MATSTMTWAQFQAIPNGTSVFNHRYSECVALANLYHESVLGKPFVAVGSAYQWWTLFRNYPALYNTYKQSSTPIPGAVVVSRYGIYNGIDGHIGVVTGVHADGTFDTLEQNAANRYVWRYRRTMQNIIGFLHPFNNPSAQPIAPETPEEEDEDMAQNAGFTTKLKGVRHDAIVNTTSGFFHAWQGGDGGMATAVGRSFGVPYDFAAITESHWYKLESDCALVRNRK